MDGIPIEKLESELREEVKRLKINREKVGVEVLKTKYAKAYNDLLESIAKKTQQIVLRFIGEEIVILGHDGEEVKKEIQKVIDDRSKEASRAVFKEYDVDKLIRIAKEIHTVAHNLWIPYWQSHCGLYVLPENWEVDGGTPRIYNDLTKEFLVDSENNIWEKHPEWENEDRCFITAGACHILVEAFLK